MRILHVIPAVAARYGGPSRAVFEMCRALQAKGCQPLVAATDADGEGRLPVELGGALLYQGVPTIFFPRQWSEAFKYSRPLSRWMDANVRHFDAVHIHAVFSHACLTAARACRRHGVPYIVRPLGTLDPWSIGQKRLRKRLFWHLGVRRMLERAAAVHYTTRAEKELAEDALGLKRGVVVPLAVDVHPFGASDNAADSDAEAESFGGRPYALVLSRLHRKKGLELLLPAFLALTKQPEFADWRLVLAGDGEPSYVASLRRLAQSSGGDGHITFTGWLDGARRRAALRRASLLALTSYQENFGLCVLEALACGVPVLVSRQVNLAPEIERAGAGWVAPLERGALEEVLVGILRDAAERALRGAAGRALVHCRFTWPAVASELTALYGSITSTA